MATNTKELDLTQTKSSAVVGGQRKGIQKQKHSNGSSSNRNSHLPSSAGGSGKSSASASSNSINSTGTMEGKGVKCGGKHRDGHGHSKKANKPGDRAPHDKGATCGSGKDFSVRQLAAEVESYHRTEWYTQCVGQGFATQAALDRFNEFVRANADGIDPRVAPVCRHCYSSDLVLCDCFVAAAAANAAVLEGDALLVPNAKRNFVWQWDWWNRVKRMFVRPNYDPQLPINHQIGWLSNASLGDDMVNTEMLAYIRLYLNVDYTINGVFDRRSKLAHAKKLALRWLDEKKIPMKARETSLAASCLSATVQKATDMEDDDMLLARNNEKHNITQYFRRPPGFGMLRVVVIAGLLMCPGLTVRTARAAMSITEWTFVRLTTPVIQFWAHGSAMFVRLEARTALNLVRAVLESTWSGIAMPCYIATRQWLCNTALTMSSTASRTAISNVLQNGATLTSGC